MTRARVNGFDWDQVDDVLLDMDGTLLDRHFDNFFFEEGLPRRYAERHGLTFKEAQARLLEMYGAVEGQLEWADLTYWTRTLGVDVVRLTRELGDLIGFLPGAVKFLQDLRARGKRLTLVTNAHMTGLEIKTERTGLDRHVDRIIHAFDVGYLKMNAEFWPTCQGLLGFDPSRTMYLDDDELCLVAAQTYGIMYPIHSAKSSSKLPPERSARFPSIVALSELIPT